MSSRLILGNTSHSVHYRNHCSLIESSWLQPAGVDNQVVRRPQLQLQSIAGEHCCRASLQSIAGEHRCRASLPGPPPSSTARPLQSIAARPTSLLHSTSSWGSSTVSLGQRFPPLSSVFISCLCRPSCISNPCSCSSWYCWAMQTAK